MVLIYVSSALSSSILKCEPPSACAKSKFADALAIFTPPAKVALLFFAKTNGEVESVAFLKT